MSTVDYDVKFDDEQYAGFGSASYRFAEKWEATVGLRVNRSQNTYTDFLHNETVVVGGAREVIPAGTPSEVDETAVLPRGEVSYHFNPDLMLYASVSEGVQPGAASVITSTTGQPFEREKTTAYELGEKGEFLDHRLRLNSAFFYTKYSDRTFTSTVIPPGGGPIRLNANIGGATNIGFEVDITAKPTSEISLHAGLGYIKSTWDKGTRYTYINLGLPPARRAPITADISGLSSPTTPSWTFDASTEWAHPLTGDLTLKVRGDVEFVSKQYFDLLDTYSENSYTIGNALVGIDYRNYSAYFQVHNMGNTRYNTDYFPRRDNGSPTDLANPGEPRMFSVTLSAKF